MDERPHLAMGKNNFLPNQECIHKWKRILLKLQDKEWGNYCWEVEYNHRWGVRLKQQVLGSFERSLGRDNATCKEGEVLTDTSEYSDTSIQILLFGNFPPRSEKVGSWQVYFSDSQILCTGGQTQVASWGSKDGVCKIKCCPNNFSSVKAFIIIWSSESFKGEKN